MIIVILISDEGYGNFKLFSDKQLRAEIESSSRDSDLENSLTIEENLK